jgi:hypothetical protein
VNTYIEIGDGAPAIYGAVEQDGIRLGTSARCCGCPGQTLTPDEALRLLTWLDDALHVLGVLR